jgi:very-short-patch-repair endonuclease
MSKKYDGMRYDDFVAARAEELRRNANCYEQLLWPRLEPWGFHWQENMYISRQYFLDFYHPDTGLNVEVDGDESHGTPEDKGRDAARDDDLYRCGITVLRVRNHRVRYELEVVVKEIEGALWELGWYQAA